VQRLSPKLLDLFLLVLAAAALCVAAIALFLLALAFVALCVSAVTGFQ
jgi:hypothetical protein